MKIFFLKYVIKCLREFCFFIVNFLILIIKMNVWGFGDEILIYFKIFCWMFLLVFIVLNILGVLIIRIFWLKWIVDVCEYFFVIDVRDFLKYCFLRIVFLVVFFLFLVLLIRIILIFFFFKEFIFNFKKRRKNSNKWFLKFVYFG